MEGQKTARFEMRFTPSRPLMEEAYRAAAPLWLKAVAVIMPASCGLMGALCLYAVWAWDARELLEQGVLLLALGALWLGYFLARPRLMARRYEKTNRELDENQGAGSAVFYFYDEEIRADETHGARMVIPYEKIVKAQESQHLILLLRKQRLMHMLDKSSLPEERLPQFFAFLREKAPQAKFGFKK